MSKSTSSTSQALSSLNNIQKTLLSALKVSSDSPIVIAYSGGVDSQVILHACYILQKTKLLQNTISVCHVNHGLSQQANAWEDNAKQYCKAYNFPLTIKRVKVEDLPQKSLEAAARDARYQALSEHAQQRSVIITGHHGDDQVETFLLALKRGSGLKGLGAMHSQIALTIDPHKSLTLLRPLLTVSREDILVYAESYQLTWVEDDSNSDVRFERNFLRHDVIPTLKKRWPSFLSTLFRSTEHIQESQILLNELAHQDLHLCLNKNKRLSTEYLLTLSQARFNNLLRFYLAEHHWLMPSTEQLEQAYQQLAETKGQSAEVKVGEVWLRVFKAQVYFTPLFKNISNWQHEIPLSLPSDRPFKVILPDGLGELCLIAISNTVDELTIGNINTQLIVAPKPEHKVTIKFIHNNPICLPDYRDKSRPLKKVLQELAIPPWERKQVPFLYYDDELVAAIGYFVCKAYIPSDTENNWKISLSLNNFNSEIK